MYNIIIKKDGKFLADWTQKRVEKDGVSYLSLSVKWTKLAKRAKVLDKGNDWRNELSEYKDFAKGCQIIPKWTEFDKFYKFYENFADKAFKILKKEEKLSNDDIVFLIKKWKETIKRITVNCWGWNEITANDIFDWGSGGHNWKLLWFPGDEDKENPKNQFLTEFVNKDSKELLKNFLYELNYCSDRMSMDRLFRCHWEFNLFLRTWLNENKLYIDHKGKFKERTW